MKLPLHDYEHLTVEERARQGINDTWAASYVCEHDIPVLLARISAQAEKIAEMSALIEVCAEMLGPSFMANAVEGACNPWPNPPSP